MATQVQGQEQIPSQGGHQEPSERRSQALTPGQTVGPFYGFALPYEHGPVIVPGGALHVHGTVFDGAGEPVPDALIEVLQADPQGRVGGLFGRCSTAPAGRFSFTTVRPGATSDGCAPHLAVMVHARGLLLQLHTRMYFPDEPRNAHDPVLAKVPDDRRHTLIAVADQDGLRFDIRLQGDGETGEGETVFFDV
ncbi:protocatechuate 3,4-dioxygenase subunit alpha [Glycomyces sp. NPDC047010]|uniref:protocatechuate 3,4-dioxygenase subunit alpha n=1 Tax=Glycomyces sp. NPDC047010 TaxID=3155023 RepID=UPI0033FCD032